MKIPQKNKNNNNANSKQQTVNSDPFSNEKQKREEKKSLGKSH